MIPDVGTRKEIKRAFFTAISEPRVGEVYMWLPESFDTECWLVVAVPKESRSVIFINGLAHFHGYNFKNKRHNWSSIEPDDWKLYTGGGHLRYMGEKPLQ